MKGRCRANVYGLDPFVVIKGLKVVIVTRNRGQPSEKVRMEEHISTVKGAKFRALKMPNASIFVECEAATSIYIVRGPTRGLKGHRGAGRRTGTWPRKDVILSSSNTWSRCKICNT